MLPTNVQVLSAICVQLAPESPVPFLTEVHCWYDLDTSFRTAPEPIHGQRSQRSRKHLLLRMSPAIGRDILGCQITAIHG